MRSGVICPILRETMFLSTVKTRSGRMYESENNVPDTKSSEVNFCAKTSPVGWDVIWHIIKSLPERSVRTKAGRLLLPDKSENGNGTTTTSPFTNLSMLRPLQALTNLLPKRFRLQDRFDFCLLSFRGSPQPDHPICEPASIATVHCFSTCYVSLTFPSLLCLFFYKSNVIF